MDRMDYLKKLAKEAGYDDVNEYILASEMLYTSRKVGAALDSVLLPDDLDKYIPEVNAHIRDEFNIK